ncbi:hypothetical protein EDEG_04200 [Edhazardia aedis USNM 41457]|uniref:Uncharacterized protein n=1 Tax=Edhazardia aedis (strain USNM 41457) TaxID=1003232 RepID=J9DQA5_EDHAE|nr:hypothetical protein EDEG_04200 [Edhazardia aedis USNM 41457]|eukprot:EJW04735.1 hypothetical protein EDEG_04200 [Edhazardia aedis USNM 41457]
MNHIFMCLFVSKILGCDDSFVPNPSQVQNTENEVQLSNSSLIFTNDSKYLSSISEDLKNVREEETRINKLVSENTVVQTEQTQKLSQPLTSTLNSAKMGKKNQQKEEEALIRSKEEREQIEKEKQENLRRINKLQQAELNREIRIQEEIFKRILTEYEKIGIEKSLIKSYKIRKASEIVDAYNRIFLNKLKSRKIKTNYFRRFFATIKASIKKNRITKLPLISSIQQNLILNRISNISTYNFMLFIMNTVKQEISYFALEFFNRINMIWNNYCSNFI